MNKVDVLLILFLREGAGKARGKNKVRIFFCLHLIKRSFNAKIDRTILLILIQKYILHILDIIVDSVSPI